MRKINHWEQLLGLTIDNVHLYPDRREVEFSLEGGIFSVEFEPANENEPYFVNFYKAGSDLMPADRIDPSILVGRTILKVVVPFVVEGFSTDSYVAFTLSDGNDVYMATEDFTPIRIS